MIESYDFGHIKIDGKDYNSDVIVDGNVRNWWRKTSHNVEVDDIKEYVKGGELVVVGNGHDSGMEVPDETVNYMKEKGCRVVVQPTKKAIATFNESKEKKLGLFHLTC